MWYTLIIKGKENKTMTKTKTFEYKGQMINYYNKVRKNPNIEFCACGYTVGMGWMVMYTYRKTSV